MTLTAVSAEAVRAPLFLVHLLAVAGCVIVLRFAWRHRDNSPAWWFSAWLAANVVWIGSHTFGLVVTDPQLRIVVDSVELAAIPVSGSCWLLFTLVYSGRWESIERRPTAVLATVTALLALVVLSNPLHQRMYPVGETGTVMGVVAVESSNITPMIWLTLAYVYSLYIVGIAVLVELVASDRLFRDQAGALLLSVIVPLAVAATLMSGRAQIPVDMTPLSFGFTSLLLSYAVFRSELLSLMPATYRVGERTAMEMVDQGVVVRDPDGRVVLTNPAAEGILGAERHRLVGRRFDDVLEASSLQARRGLGTADEKSGEPALSDGGIATRDDYVTQTLHDATTGRAYEVHESAIDDEEGPTLGQTLFFRDVTDERRRKERLLVLNRIVRHNLRNDMNVLRGHVELIQEDIDNESAAVVGNIASDLVQLGEKAHQMDRIIRESSVEETPVNVAGIVDRVADRQGANATGPIEVRGAVQAWTDTSSPIVRAIVSNLVENALERSEDESSREQFEDERAAGGSENLATGEDRSEDRSDGAVVVDVVAEDDEVTVAVTDVGPEIPEQEVATLLEGEVSALQHSAGIGLWTVRWCADIADADLEIDTGEETTISVTFSGEAELQTAATGAP